MFLSKILIHLCIVIHDIGEENIFIVIVFKVLVQKKILKRDVKDCFKINGKQMIKMSKTVNMLDSKTMKIK